MKRYIIITTIAVAGIASFLYCAIKSVSHDNNNRQFKKKSHHMTDSFAKAKKLATDIG